MGFHILKAFKVLVETIATQDAAKLSSENILQYLDDHELSGRDLVTAAWVLERILEFEEAIVFVGAFEDVESLEEVPLEDIPEGAYAFVGTGINFSVYFYDFEEQVWVAQSIIPTNILEALLSAEGPSVSNPFATMADLASTGGLPSNIVDALLAASEPSSSNAFITEQDIENLDLPTGARVLDYDLVIESSTEGSISVTWIDFEGDNEELVDEELTFNTAPAQELPSAGNFRYDLIQVFDDGTLSIKQGTEANEGAVAPPSPDSGALGVVTILWNSEGEAQQQPPQTGPPNQSAWSNTRFNTAGGPNTTGKFAKIWEGNLSRDNNYAIILAYNDPRNVVNFNGPGAGRVKVSWTCATNRDIIADTVKFFTDPDSAAGEFRLVQIAGNKAALYHKGSHYWSRLDFRVLFQSSAVRLQDFVNNGAYGSTPSAVATWDSEVMAGGGGSTFTDFTPSTGDILFDQNRKYGFTTPLTGDIDFSVSGGFESTMVKIIHNDTTAPTFDVIESGIDLIFEGGEYEANVDNYIYAILHKNDAGTAFAISYNINKNEV